MAPPEQTRHDRTVPPPPLSSRLLPRVTNGHARSQRTRPQHAQLPPPPLGFPSRSLHVAAHSEAARADYPAPRTFNAPSTGTYDLPPPRHLPDNVDDWSEHIRPEPTPLSPSEQDTCKQKVLAAAQDEGARSGRPVPRIIFRHSSALDSALLQPQMVTPPQFWLRGDAMAGTMMYNPYQYAEAALQGYDNDLDAQMMMPPPLQSQPQLICKSSVLAHTESTMLISRQISTRLRSRSTVTCRTVCRTPTACSSMALTGKRTPMVHSCTTSVGRWLAVRSLDRDRSEG